ncbi:MAG: PEP-CTERM sorting domain-containing protein [Anaerolineae bacterium]
MTHNKIVWAVISFLLALILATTASAQISMLPLSPYTQNFDTLAISGSSSTLPTGWALAETGTGANTTYTAGTGSGNTGDTYSFGATSSTERALGTLQSGSVIPVIGVGFTNNTGNTIGQLGISYTCEQWRLGATARVDRLDFQYSTDATSLTTGTWTNFDLLDCTAPVTSGTVGALDGNAANNRLSISSSLSGTLSIPNGTSFWIRWQDFNAAGADDGLAVDDFSLNLFSPLAVTVNDFSASNTGPAPLAVVAVLGVIGTAGVAVARRKRQTVACS